MMLPSKLPIVTSFGIVQNLAQRIIPDWANLISNEDLSNLTRLSEKILLPPGLTPLK